MSSLQFARGAMAAPGPPRADAAAWDVVGFQRRLQPQLPAPRAFGPVAPRPSAACGRWQPARREAPP